jgi:hypothetical protein
MYAIVRHYMNASRMGHRRIIKKGLTLEEARKWCNNPETNSRTCSSAKGKRRTQRYGPWFDGYEDKERL